MIHALPSAHYQSVWPPPGHQTLLTSSAWQVLQACAWTGWISLVHVASFGCMLAVRTPGALLTARVCRGLRFRLPLWETGSATPITFDFGAIFPFTLFRPTTSLSTLRSGRCRTPRKTRYTAAG